MKKTIILLFAFLLVITLAGCGKNDNKNNLKGDIKENTKVSNISESYTKYSELKTKAYEKLSDKIPEEEFGLSFGLLGFLTGDLIIVPISICGLTQTEAAYSYALFNIKDYQSDASTCNMTFKDDDGKNTRFETLYDKTTDSIKATMYEGTNITSVYEYVKLDKGYATLQYYYNEDGITSFRSIFNEDYMSVGMFENVDSKLDTIFKDKSTPKTEWTKGGVYWVEYDNGEFDSEFDE